jgi:hypothetical protein
VRPPLEPLEALQARSYQLLAQLTAVKSLLLLHRAQLDMAVAQVALAQSARCIEAELAGTDTARDRRRLKPARPSPASLSSRGPTRCWPPTSRPGCCAA